MHPYSSPTATQHPACGLVTSRVSRGEDLLCLERQHELARLNTQGKHAHAYPSHARQILPGVPDACVSMPPWNHTSKTCGSMYIYCDCVGPKRPWKYTGWQGSPCSHEPIYMWPCMWPCPPGTCMSPCAHATFQVVPHGPMQPGTARQQLSKGSHVNPLTAPCRHG